MRPIRTALLAFLATLALTSAARAQGEDENLALDDLTRFEEWFADYQKGAFRMVKDGLPDQSAYATVDEILGKLAKWNTLPMAEKLFAVATVQLRPPGAQATTEAMDFLRELQPWKVKEAARRHLAAMTGDGIAPWLVAMTRSRNLREKGHPDQVRAAAALRVLGASKSVEGQLALLEATGSMPVELRVKAVSALAQGSDPATVPQLLPLLKDKEPNVRIATANAIGRALGTATDETVHEEISAEIAAQRDEAVAALERLFKDKVWQVRSAAAYGLANLKCKAAIPALIEGLKQELKRKKDPWAMDLRLHRILEGMTGQKMLPGKVAMWEAFWKEEGPTFAYRKAADSAKNAAVEAAEDRYQSFFNLELDSDRVLFVVDFSGSMEEPVTITSGGTAAQSGETMIKAELVVKELKKMVLSLPDGAMFNIVVFNDEVKVWREERDGRPALVRLDDNSRDDLLGSFLDQLHPSGPTNLYGALDKALGFAGRGLYDKYYEAGFDSLYILSDGAPSWGEVIDKDEIRRRVREANGLRKLAIHCITFGQLNDVEFLAQLAAENGGRHHHVK